MRPFLFSALLAFAGVACAYDPLAREAAKPGSLALAVPAAKEGGHEVPLRVYLPATKSAAPVVLFSHGLGGSREGNAFMGEHWATRGYVAVFLQHEGSDEAVWRDKPPGERMAAMRRAASARNLFSRVDDVRATIDAMERWNREAASPLAGRMDLDRIGMSGHSFGAVTTQAVSGQRIPLVAPTREPRIGAAMMFSPSVPRMGDAKRAFSGAAIPWMLMTGTHDTAMVANQAAESRLGVFPALPPGDKYELVLDHAEHSAFTDRALPGDREPRNPNHHRAILALSTAFWDAYLKRDAEARTWLEGDGPRKVLEAADRWQRK